MGESNDDWQEAEAQLLNEVRQRKTESPPSDARGRGVLLRFIDRLRQRAAI
jgi:hypothetical protein